MYNGSEPVMIDDSGGTMRYVLEPWSSHSVMKYQITSITQWPISHGQIYFIVLNHQLSSHSFRTAWCYSLGTICLHVVRPSAPFLCLA